MKKMNFSKEQFFDAVDFPKDICLGQISVKIFGNKEIYIENYKGLLDYTPCCIVISGRDCRIAIEGTNLIIDFFTELNMKICGNISCIGFVNEKR